MSCSNEFRLWSSVINILADSGVQAQHFLSEQQLVAWRAPEGPQQALFESTTCIAMA